MKESSHWPTSGTTGTKLVGVDGPATPAPRLGVRSFWSELAAIGRFCARSCDWSGGSLRRLSSPLAAGPISLCAAMALPLMKLANGGGASSSSETTTKPNCKKWSMTFLEKGTHTSCRWRANVSFRGTSRPSRRTTQPELRSWLTRMVRAAWMEGDA